MTTFNSLLLLSVLLTIVFTLLKNWRKFYYALRIPGPLNIPLLGTVKLLLAVSKDFYFVILKLLELYVPVARVVRVWLGTHLIIISTRPKDLEIVINNCLNKSFLFKLFPEVIDDSLLTADVDIWKKNRKYVNAVFNQHILNSHHSTVVRYAEDLAQFLEENQGTEQKDVLTHVWKRTLDNALETLFNVNPKKFPDRYDFLPSVSRVQEIYLRRFHKFWLLSDFIWKRSNLYKEFCEKSKRLRQVVANVLNEDQIAEQGDIKSKYFLPYLLQMKQESKITSEQIFEESVLALIAGSETNAVTVTFTLLVLGIHLDIQDKVYNEIVTVLGRTPKAPTLADLSRLEYLERVIKETMRLFPVFPIIIRRTDADLNFDPYIFPKDSTLLIPIIAVHKDRNVWPNPDHFDPDRFLPKEVEKRHKYAYLPFSQGPRNCVGFASAMMAMKTMLCINLHRLKVKTTSCKTIKDINVTWAMLAKPKNNAMIFQSRP